MNNGGTFIGLDLEAHINENALLKEFETVFKQALKKNEFMISETLDLVTNTNKQTFNTTINKLKKSFDLFAKLNKEASNTLKEDISRGLSGDEAFKQFNKNTKKAEAQFKKSIRDMYEYAFEKAKHIKNPITLYAEDINVDFVKLKAKTATDSMDVLKKKTSEVVNAATIYKLNVIDSLLQKMTRSLVGFMSQSIDTFRQVQKNLLLTTAVANGTSATYDQLYKSAIEISKVAPKSIEEISDQMMLLAQAGLSATEIMEAMPSAVKLSVGTGSDLKNTLEAVVSTINAFNMEFSEAPRVLDIFAKAAANTRATIEKLQYSLSRVTPFAEEAGVSLENVTSILSLLYNNGLKASVAGTVVSNTIQGLTTFTDKSVNALSQLGLTTADVSLEFNEIGEVLEKLAESGINADQSFALFNRRGKLISSLIQKMKNDTQGIDGSFERLENTVYGVGSNMDFFRIQTDSLDYALNKLRNSVDEIQIKFGDTLKDSIIFLSGVIQNLTESISQSEYMLWAFINLATSALVISSLSRVTIGFLKLYESLDALGIVVASSSKIMKFFKFLTLGEVSIAILGLVTAIGFLTDLTSTYIRKKKEEMILMQESNDRYVQTIEYLKEINKQKFNENKNNEKLIESKQVLENKYGIEINSYEDLQNALKKYNSEKERQLLLETKISNAKEKQEAKRELATLKEMESKSGKNLDKSLKEAENALSPVFNRELPRIFEDTTLGSFLKGIDITAPAHIDATTMLRKWGDETITSSIRTAENPSSVMKDLINALSGASGNKSVDKAIEAMQSYVDMYESAENTSLTISKRQDRIEELTKANEEIDKKLGVLSIDDQIFQLKKALANLDFSSGAIGNKQRESQRIQSKIQELMLQRKELSDDLGEVFSTEIEDVINFRTLMQQSFDSLIKKIKAEEERKLNIEMKRIADAYLGKTSDKEMNEKSIEIKEAQEKSAKAVETRITNLATSDATAIVEKQMDSDKIRKQVYSIYDAYLNATINNPNNEEAVNETFEKAITSISAYSYLDSANVNEIIERFKSGNREIGDILLQSFMESSLESGDIQNILGSYISSLYTSGGYISSTDMSKGLKELIQQGMNEFKAGLEDKYFTFQEGLNEELKKWQKENAGETLTPEEYKMIVNRTKNKLGKNVSDNAIEISNAIIQFYDAIDSFLSDLDDMGDEISPEQIKEASEKTFNSEDLAKLPKEYLNAMNTLIKSSEIKAEDLPKIIAELQALRTTTLNNMFGTLNENMEGFDISQSEIKEIFEKNKNTLIKTYDLSGFTDKIRESLSVDYGYEDKDIDKILDEYLMDYVSSVLEANLPENIGISSNLDKQVRDKKIENIKKNLDAEDGLGEIYENYYNTQKKLIETRYENEKNRINLEYKRLITGAGGEETDLGKELVEKRDEALVALDEDFINLFESMSSFLETWKDEADKLKEFTEEVMAKTKSDFEAMFIGLSSSLSDSAGNIASTVFSLQSLMQTSKDDMVDIDKADLTADQKQGAMAKQGAYAGYQAATMVTDLVFAINDSILQEKLDKIAEEVEEQKELVEEQLDIAKEQLAELQKNKFQDNIAKSIVSTKSTLEDASSKTDLLNKKLEKSQELEDTNSVMYQGGGLAAGAGAGALAGSAFGPAGTAAGAVIGGLVGLFAGKKAEKEAQEKAKEQSEKTQAEIEALEEEIESINEAIQDRIVGMFEGLGLSVENLTSSLITSSKSFIDMSKEVRNNIFNTAIQLSDAIAQFSNISLSKFEEEFSDTLEEIQESISAAETEGDTSNQIEIGAKKLVDIWKKYSDDMLDINKSIATSFKKQLIDLEFSTVQIANAITGDLGGAVTYLSDVYSGENKELAKKEFQDFYKNNTKYSEEEILAQEEKVSNLLSLYESEKTTGSHNDYLTAKKEYDDMLETNLNYEIKINELGDELVNSVSEFLNLKEEINEEEDLYLQLVNLSLKDMVERGEISELEAASKLEQISSEKQLNELYKNNTHLINEKLIEEELNLQSLVAQLEIAKEYDITQVDSLENQIRLQKIKIEEIKRENELSLEGIQNTLAGLTTIEQKNYDIAKTSEDFNIAINNQDLDGAISALDKLASYAMEKYNTIASIVSSSLTEGINSAEGLTKDALKNTLGQSIHDTIIDSIIEGFMGNSAIKDIINSFSANINTLTVSQIETYIDSLVDELDLPIEKINAMSNAIKEALGLLNPDEPIVFFDETNIEKAMDAIEAGDTVGELVKEGDGETEISYADLIKQVNEAYIQIKDSIEASALSYNSDTEKFENIQVKYETLFGELGDKIDDQIAKIDELSSTEIQLSSDDLVMPEITVTAPTIEVPEITVQVPPDIGVDTTDLSTLFAQLKEKIDEQIEDLDSLSTNGVNINISGIDASNIELPTINVDARIPDLLEIQGMNLALSYLGTTSTYTKKIYDHLILNTGDNTFNLRDSNSSPSIPML